MRSAPALSIQRLAGHENLQTTLGYMHLAQGRDRAGHPASRLSANRRRGGGLGISGSGGAAASYGNLPATEDARNLNGLN
jgi:hypothetical protein